MKYSIFDCLLNEKQISNVELYNDIVLDRLHDGNKSLVIKKLKCINEAINDPINVNTMHKRNTIYVR